MSELATKKMWGEEQFAEWWHKNIGSKTTEKIFEQAKNIFAEYEANCGKVSVYAYDETDTPNLVVMIIEGWKYAAINVLGAISDADKKYISAEDFIKKCSACGGDWGGMLLSGVKKIYPAVWDAIPNDLGLFGFGCICAVIKLLGVDMK